MEVADFLKLLGGLALFLYGMQMMSAGLEAAAGNRMKGILEKLTTNRFLGVAVGAGITAVIQSSSATTVMVVGFVNSGMLQLQQAVWVIMGANIGTTVTGQLIALDIGALAPLIAFCGVVLVIFTKRPQLHHWGSIIAGLGVLFIGMDMMSGAMMPLRESETFVELITHFNNPLVGITVGMLFTALIQSSSASVGILQALAMSGLIGLPSAVYVLFGQNIGTCITAILASIGANRNAKRTTIIHLMFNIFGTVLFTLICYFTPLTELVASWTPNNAAAQIANMHTLFNIVTTLLLLPLGTYMALLAQRILPETEKERSGVFGLEYLKPLNFYEKGAMGTSAMIARSIAGELGRMTKMVADNVDQSFAAVEKDGVDRSAEIEKREEYIDYLNKEIMQYISGVVATDLSRDELSVSTSFFKICSNLERIGDHAMNIVNYSKRMAADGISLSPAAMAEVGEMRGVCRQAMAVLMDPDKTVTESLVAVGAKEQKTDDMTEQFRHNQIERMRSGVCSAEACVLYSEMLSDFERIGDHILNIGEALANSDMGKLS